MRPPIAWAITALFALFSSVALRPAQAIPLACPGPARLVSAGAVWRYRDTGLDPGAAWTTAEYDDSGWGSGTAQLGYGDGDETTLVGYGPDGNNKYVTTWFRRAFSVTDPGGLISLTLLVVRDDGAIVHLNGRPVFTSNMPVGAILSSTFAASVVGGADESAWFSASVAAIALQTGTNILAVETHQANVASSDISFDLALCGWPSGGAPTSTSTPTETPRPTLPPPPPGTLRFASVGDFGSVAFQPGQFPPPRQVADLIRTWNPEFVITVGDNNYCSGSQFDACVGGYYHDFISPYTGAYGGGAAENRFWPALGNHDWDAGIATTRHFSACRATRATMISCGGASTSSFSIATGASRTAMPGTARRDSGSRRHWPRRRRAGTSFPSITPPTPRPRMATRPGCSGHLRRWAPTPCSTATTMPTSGSITASPTL